MTDSLVTCLDLVEWVVLFDLIGEVILVFFIEPLRYFFYLVWIVNQ